MVSIQRRETLISILLTIILTISGLTFIKVYKLINIDIVVKIDDLIDNKIQNGLKNIILNNSNLKTLCTQTFTNLNYIDFINARILGSGKTIIKIKAKNPIFLIKNTTLQKDYILLKDALVEKDIYQDSMLTNLYTIYINTKLPIENIKDDLISLSEMPIEILDKYKLTWINENKIILTPLQNGMYSIITNQKNLTLKKINLAEKIYKTKNKKISLDIRFEKSIICCMGERVIP